MGIEGFDEKIEVANKIVADYVEKFRNRSNCEIDVLIY